MKKFLKIVAIVLAFSFILIQFSRPTRTNPPINPSETLEASADVPLNVREILARSCNDCHTNNTNWIWYSNIAPVSWGMVDHVNLGREELNFSKWATYKDEQKARKFDEICEEISSGEMPHYQYLWLHWDAKMSEGDVNTLCDWAKEEGDKLQPPKHSG